MCMSCCTLLAQPPTGRSGDSVIAPAWHFHLLSGSGVPLSPDLAALLSSHPLHRTSSIDWMAWPPPATNNPAPQQQEQQEQLAVEQQQQQHPTTPALDAAPSVDQWLQHSGSAATGGISTPTAISLPAAPALSSAQTAQTQAPPSPLLIGQDQLQLHKIQIGGETLFHQPSPGLQGTFQPGAHALSGLTPAAAAAAAAAGPSGMASSLAFAVASQLVGSHAVPPTAEEARAAARAARQYRKQVRHAKKVQRLSEQQHSGYPQAPGHRWGPELMHRRLSASPWLRTVCVRYAAHQAGAPPPTAKGCDEYTRKWLCTAGPG